MTLETQYKNFSKDNPNAKIHFEAWKKINARLIKQALINMMKKDEELGLYDEPFKHKVETIPAEEILANRSNAYEFIDFDKQETLEETAKEFFRKFKHTHSPDNYYLALVEFAKWQQENNYSEEEVYDIVQKAIKENSSKQLHFFDGGYSNPIYNNLKKWFKQFKKK